MTDDDSILSEEDQALFRQYMRHVKPLNPSKHYIPQKTPTLKTKPIFSKKEYHNRVAATPLPKPHLMYDTSETVQSESVLSFSHEPTLSKKRLRELKRGKIPYTARLDLHGLRLDTAEQALYQFIQHQAQLKHRCVLIIHGKGGRFGEDPVLKNHVNCWLKQFPEILAFHSALEKHGGSGAVYVLLKN